MFFSFVSGLVCLATVIASRALVLAAAKTPATRPAYILIVNSFYLNFSGPNVYFFHYIILS